MDRIGKEISELLLARSFEWKREVHKINKSNMIRMLQCDNHYVLVFCLICDAPLIEIMEIDGMRYGECAQCCHLQAINRPSRNYLEALYGSQGIAYTSQDLAYVDVSTSVLQDRISHIASPKVDFIVENIEYEHGDLWVDIGSGTGDLLIEAQNIGFSTMGIEASPSEINIATTRGIRTLNIFYDGTQLIPELKEAKIVSLINLLEHVDSPKTFLKNTISQMKQGSYFVMEVPRYNSASTIFQQFNSDLVYKHIWSPGHINIFSDHSLSKLLDVSGARIIGKWLFGSDAIEIYGQIINSISPGIKGDLLFYLKNIRYLQSVIDRAGLSDVMLVVSQKV